MTQQIIITTPANSGDGTPLATAFTYCNSNFSELYGRAQPAPPPTLVGSIGDEAGMYASDPTYFYYCFANYDGSSVIWAQVTQVANIAVSAIQFGTSNIQLVGPNGDATVNINGTSNIAAFRSTGLFVTGIVSATGNITSTNINGGTISATRIIGGDVSATGAVVAVGNVSANNINITGHLTTGTGLLAANAFTGPFDDGIVIDYVTGNGRISVGSSDSITLYNNGIGNTAIVSFDPNGNILTGGAIQSTGNIGTTGIISATGNVVTSGYFVGTFIGNVTGNFVVPGSNTQIIFNTSGNADAVGGLTYNKDSNTMIVLGVVSARGNVIAGNVTTAGQISATANISGANLRTGGSVSATGNITGSSIFANLSATTASASGNITGGNILTGGLLSVTGNVTGGNLTTAGQISAIGNIRTANNLFVTKDINVSGDVTATAYAGTTVSIIGNITGGNLSTGGRITSTGNISSVGNISAAFFLGNGSQLSGLNTNAIQNGNSNVLVGSAGGNISVNVNGISPITLFTPLGQTTSGVLSASGNIVSSGNVTGGNLTTSGRVITTGNVVGANIVATGNLYYNSNILVTRSVLVGTRTTPVTIPLSDNGSFNVLTRDVGNVVVTTTT